MTKTHLRIIFAFMLLNYIAILITAIITESLYPFIFLGIFFIPMIQIYSIIK